MIKQIASMVTGVLVYAAVALLAFPFYWFFEMGKGKSWTAYMGEILNIQS